MQYTLQKCSIIVIINQTPYLRNGSSPHWIKIVTNHLSVTQYVQTLVLLKAN